MDLSNLLNFMIQKGASDLYVSPGAPVLVKINGRTVPVSEERHLDASETKRMAYDMMNDQQIRQFEEHWEVNLGISVSQIGRFRVNVLRQRGQVAFVIRAIPTTPPTLEALHLPAFFADLISQKRGLILVAGATGSGKTTTMAALIEHRNRTQHGHILTIEDPIEYLFKYQKSIVNQREIGTDTKSYSNALKSAMREAPDVILIGEIRDADTMRQAIVYAETGHLCMATIHASNSIETLDRVINFFNEEQRKQVLIDLGHNLRAVICQRLIRGKDKNLYPAVEVMRDTPYITELIQKGKLDDIREALDRNLEEDVITFDDSIIALYDNGLISEEEAIAHASSRHNVTTRIRLSKTPEWNKNKKQDAQGGGLSISDD